MATPWLSHTPRVNDCCTSGPFWLMPRCNTFGRSVAERSLLSVKSAYGLDTVGLCPRASGAVTIMDFEYILESVSWERRDSLLDIRRGGIELEGVSEDCWRLKIYKTDWLLRVPYFGPILIRSTTENQQHLQQPPLPPSCAIRYRPRA